MLIALTSAGGSPGVTTTAVALAVMWPRPVLVVEADPSGRSAMLAGFFRGQQDRAGLVELVAAHHSGLLATTLPRMAFPIEANDHARFLVGGKSHEQAPGLAKLWEPLLGVLRDLSAGGQDVLIDAGRLGLEGWPRPLVMHSDVTLLFMRSSLPAIVGSRSWSAALMADARPGHVVHAVPVGEGDPYSLREIGQALGMSPLGSVAWDPRRAAVFSEGKSRPVSKLGQTNAAFDASAYARSIQKLGRSVMKAAETGGLDSLETDRWVTQGRKVQQR